MAGYHLGPAAPSTSLLWGRQPASQPISVSDHHAAYDISIPLFNFEDPAAEDQLCYDILIPAEEAISALPELPDDLSPGGFVFEPPSDFIALPYNFEDPPLLQQSSLRSQPIHRSPPSSPRRRRRTLPVVPDPASGGVPALGAPPPRAGQAAPPGPASPVLPVTIDGLLSLNIAPGSQPARPPDTPPQPSEAPSPASTSSTAGPPSARASARPSPQVGVVVEQRPAGSLHSRLVAALRSTEAHFDPVAFYTRARGGARGPVQTAGPRRVELHRDFTFDGAPAVREGSLSVLYVNTSKKHALRVTPAAGIAEIYPVLVAADTGEALDGEPIVSITKARVEAASRKVRVEAQAKGGPMEIADGQEAVLQALGLVFRRKGGFGRSLYAIAAVGRRPDGEAELLGYVAPLRCVTREDQIPGYAPPDPNAPRERPRKKYRITAAKKGGGAGPPGSECASAGEGARSGAASADEGTDRDAAFGIDDLPALPPPGPPLTPAASLTSPLIPDTPYSFLGACI